MLHMRRKAEHAMKSPAATFGAMLVGTFAVICCAGPPLMAAIGTTAFAAWLSYLGYVVIPMVILCVAIAGFCFYRFRMR